MKIKGGAISLIRKVVILAVLAVLVLLAGCTTVDYALVARSETEQSGRHDEAIKNARQGIALNPQYAPNWYWLGIASYRKKDFDEAVTAFKKVVELRPQGDQLQSSYKFLGWSYYMKGNYGEALRHFNKALELKPSEQDALDGRGRAYCLLGRYDEGIGDLSKVIELMPAGSEPLLFRGWAYHYQGNFSLAVSDFSRAAENSKPEEKTTLQTALRGKAFAYLGLGDLETAVALLQQARAALEYNNSYDLTLLYFAAGDREKAWQYRGGRGAVGMGVRDYQKDKLSGALVDKTIPGGPAVKAGVLAGDIIIGLGGAPVANMQEFLKLAAALEPGTTARLKIWREGRPREIDLKVAFADFLLESDRIIVPVLARGKAAAGGKVSAVPAEPAPAVRKKSDVAEPPRTAPRVNRSAYAIVIGIEQYRQKLPRADYAVNDARAVAEYLVQAMGYPEENVITLTNEYAAKSDFEKYFEKWLWNNVEKDSTVFVYFSGHGAPDPKSGAAYLVPYDGDPSFIGQTGYPLQRLYETLGRLQVKKIIVALDSCFSGAGGRSVLAKGARPLVMSLANSTALSGNMTVLSASAGDQISSTYEEKGHGLFTYFLLKGLKNEDVVRPDGTVALGDLFGYLKPQVERIARKQYNNEQTPQLLGGRNH